LCFLLSFKTGYCCSVILCAHLQDGLLLCASLCVSRSRTYATFTTRWLLPLCAICYITLVTGRV
jgi:hypothetical protein